MTTSMASIFGLFTLDSINFAKLILKQTARCFILRVRICFFYQKSLESNKINKSTFTKTKLAKIR